MSDYFDSSNGDFDIQKSHINGEGEWVITAGFTNNGILGRTNVNAKLFDANTITIDMFGAAFYRQFPYKMVTHARVFSIKPKFEMSPRQGLFFANALTYLRTLFGYENMCSWEKIKSMYISLPQTNSGDIDFAFMESFVCELEKVHLNNLDAYLLATGLNDYHLTSADRQTFNSFNDYRWKEFKIGDLFERISTKKLSYKAKDLPQKPTENNTLPCLTSSFMNQGLNYYAPREGATIINNVISIPSNSDVYRAYYQSRDFTVLSDAYAIRWKDDSIKIQSKQYLFMVACINQVTDLPIYSYKNKLGGWNVVKNKYITLPVTADGQPDLSAMEQLVGALQKIVIADVVKYTAERIDSTRLVISSTQQAPNV